MPRLTFVISCLFGTLALLSPPAWSEQGTEFILQDIVARFLHQLAAQGTSGERCLVTVPRETYEVMVEEAESGQPSNYLVHQAPIRVEVEQWEIESATFTAERITLLSLAVQLYQGTPQSIERHLRQPRSPDSTAQEEKDIPGGGVSSEPAQVAGASNTLEFVQSRETLFRVGKLEVRQGNLLAVDTLSDSPRLVQIGDISLDASGLVVPDQLREKPLEWQLALEVRGASPGQLQARLHDESRENLSNFRFSCNVKDLDISLLAPFLPIEEEWRIQSGIAGLTLNATCVDNQYKSSNRLSFKRLNIEGGSSDSWFDNLTSKVIAKAGSAVYEDVQLNFEVSGDLSNPDFDLGEAYSEAFQTALFRWTTLQALRRLRLTED